MLFAPHILFPVDFSGRCQAVRPSVEAIARHFQAKVTLMHVIHIPADCYAGMGRTFPVMEDPQALTENGRERLESFFGKPQGVPTVETVVDYGDPAACITEYAEEHGVGLIMIPTHGYGKFRSLLLGSVTAKVLHDAKCGVWTAAHTDDLASTGRDEVRNILCAVGLEPENAGVICHAANLARSFKAGLRLVHAVTLTEVQTEKHLDTESRPSLLTAVREEIATMQRNAGTHAEVFLELGNVSSVVREAALRHRSDLVVIGRGRLQQTFGRLRTNAYAIVRDSPCPVLSV